MAEHKACADLVAATGDSVANSSQHAGECVSSPSSGVDDSGTESGEDFRLLSPEILAEVQSALSRLEAALPGLDPVRREALIRLVNRLQSCLKLQPPPSLPTAPPPPTPPNPQPLQPPVKRYANRRQRHQRHTVGVSKEELADARRWLLETGQQTDTSTEHPPEASSVESQSSINLSELQENKSVPQVFRPVKFNPNQLKVSDSKLPDEITIIEPEPFDSSGDIGEEPVVLSAALTYVPKVDSGSSLLEYDPSLVLFTPAQSVQIAVHKAAINKQISEEEIKREISKREESYDSDDGDISSVEEEQSFTTRQAGLEDAISSAQRLLQIATDNKKTPTPGRFHDRSSKKQKFKRANTIDIPKPINFYEMEGLSADEFDSSLNDMNKNSYLNNKIITDQKLSQPPFQPKTESDLKFLAFLQQANKNDIKTAATYNPSARGGQPWTNRFVGIKTAFEAAEPESKQTPQNKTLSSTIAQNWQTNSTNDVNPNAMRQAVQNRTPQPLQNKLPWNSKQEEGVVIGSLTVQTSPGLVNKFSHAPKSAFKPIEKKPVSQPQKLTMQTQKSVILPQPKAIKKSNPILQQSKLSESKISSQQPINSKVTPSISGTVKQLATQKFSGENIPSKPIIKQYPAIQDKQFNASNSVKQHPFVEQISKNVNTTEPVNQILTPQQLSTSIASAHRQLTNQPELDTVKFVKIPQKTPTKNFKDGIEFSPPKQYINSPPVNKHYSDPFDYPDEHRIESSFPTVSNHQTKSEIQELLHEPNAVPYYSQQPAYVQHTTYTQPLMNYSQQPAYPSHTSSQTQHSLQQYPISSEPVEEYPTKVLQQQSNSSFIQPEEKHHMYDQYTKENIPSTKILTKTMQTSIPYSQNVRDEPHQHRFSDESLVPNPLVLSQVYKPVPAGFKSYEQSPVVPPYEPPVPTYEPPPMVPVYDPPVATPIKPAFSSTTNNLYENNSSQGSLASSKHSDSSSSIKQYLNIPHEYGHDISPVISNTPKSPYFDESVNSSGAPSPHWNPEDIEDNEISLSEGTEIQTAITKVMGHAQCQKAVTVTNRTQHRFDDDRPDSLLRTLLKSPHSPTNMARKQNLESGSAFTESSQSPKSPLLDKSMKNKSLPDIYSYPVVAKPPALVTPQNDRVQNLQSKPVSSAASAFRPLVNNLSKPPEIHRPPPVPPSPPAYRKNPEPESRITQTSTKISSSHSLLSSNKHYEFDLLPKPHSSVSPSRSPSSTSPSFPNVLQKSESWHQLVKEQMAVGRHPPPKSPRLSKTKSSHTLAFPKQYEAHLTADTLAVKQSKVDQYLKPSSKQSVKTSRQSSKQKKTVSIVKLDDNLENVDEAFESLFQEVAKKK